MTRSLARIAAATAAVAMLAVAAAAATPEVIRLPRGFRPEGIVALTPPYFAVGSLAGDGRIFTFNAASGTGMEVFNTPNQTIVGMSYDRQSGVLWVAGGPTGGNVLALSDAGATLLVTVEVPKDGNTAPAFLNDAIVVPSAKAVAVTDSANAAIYVVPTAAACTAKGFNPASAARRVPLTGDWVQVQGFNANGIEYSRRAQSLVVIQSATGLLFSVGWDGVATTIPVTGGPLTFGDGLLFDASDPAVLYVVRNRLRIIAVVRFANVGNLLAGARVERNITNADWETPTTVAATTSGELLAVDARFGVDSPGEVDYFVYRVPSATGGGKLLAGRDPRVCGHRRPRIGRRGGRNHRVQRHGYRGRGY
ncbi:hypothetical protein MMPV_004254 [Pyropia vietnamensis]